jgi:hypothetical protein
VTGGLLVLGSIHTEMQALLADKRAPLFNRTTDEIELSHLDIASLVAMLRHHTELTAPRLLSLWALFEGVPKFYRDCFEQGVLGAGRRELVRKMFFLSSSPLRSEADNWFLKELRGRYDLVLKHIARHEGCTHSWCRLRLKQYLAVRNESGLACADSVLVTSAQTEVARHLSLQGHCLACSCVVESTGRSKHAVS